MSCVLCHSKVVSDYCKTKKSSFYHCHNCGVVYRNPTELSSQEDEKQRYLLHNEDSNDKGYRASVQPLINTISNDFAKPHKIKGLDYGSGTSAIVAKMLTEKGFHMHLWDPFFYPDTSVFESKYDFVSCSETMEHFHNPLIEFQKIIVLLKKNGALYCKTELLTPVINFKEWYYKNDPTHVVFYNETSLKWIQKQCGFNSLKINGNVIVFRK